MPGKRRHPRGTEGAPNPPSDIPHKGAFARLTGTSSVVWHASHPSALMAATMVQWSDYQPTFPVHFSGIDADGKYRIQAIAGMRTK